MVEQKLPKLTTRVRFPSPAPAALLLCLTAGAASAGPLPFEGEWDCEVGVFVFTATTYDPGGEEMEILDIARDGNAYVLTFADDYQLVLTMNPDGTMDWFSGASGDVFTCRPLP